MIKFQLWIRWHRKNFFVLFLFLGQLIAFSQNAETKDFSEVRHFNGLPVSISYKYASNPIANILVLPGWNHPVSKWCSGTRMCREANRRGFNLILVDMQKSVYLDQSFPETSKDLARQPTRKWLVEGVWKEILENRIIDGTLKSLIAGISTGGRGAAVIGLEHPELFHGVATLSGDFCPSLSKNDRLMISALGPYRDFKTRWIGDNDLVRRAGEMKVNIFIAHSRADTVVDSRQSVEFYDGLSKSGQCPKKQLRLIDGGGHNYDYWDSEIVPMLDFFESTLEKASR